MCGNGLIFTNFRINVTVLLINFTEPWIVFTKVRIFFTVLWINFTKVRIFFTGKIGYLYVFLIIKIIKTFKIKNAL